MARGQGEEVHHVAATIGDVAVEEQSGVGDLHLLAVRVNVIHEGVQGHGEVVTIAHVTFAKLAAMAR